MGEELVGEVFVPALTEYLQKAQRVQTSHNSYITPTIPEENVRVFLQLCLEAKDFKMTQQEVLKRLSDDIAGFSPSTLENQLLEALKTAYSNARQVEQKQQEKSAGDEMRRKQEEAAKLKAEQEKAEKILSDENAKVLSRSLKKLTSAEVALKEMEKNGAGLNVDETLRMAREKYEQANKIFEEDKEQTNPQTEYEANVETENKIANILEGFDGLIAIVNGAKQKADKEKADEIAAILKREARLGELNQKKEMAEGRIVKIPVDIENKENKLKEINSGKLNDQKETLQKLITEKTTELRKPKRKKWTSEKESDIWLRAYGQKDKTIDQVAHTTASKYFFWVPIVGYFINKAYEKRKEEMTSYENELAGIKDLEDHIQSEKLEVKDIPVAEKLGLNLDDFKKILAEKESIINERNMLGEQLVGARRELGQVELELSQLQAPEQPNNASAHRLSRV